MKRLIAVLCLICLTGCAALADGFIRLNEEYNAREWYKAQGEANWLMRTTPAEFIYRHHLVR